MADNLADFVENLGDVTDEQSGGSDTGKSNDSPKDDTGDAKGTELESKRKDGAGEGSQDDGGGDTPPEDGAVDDDEGYVVDEVEEDEQTPPTEETKGEPSNLAPDMQYIVDRLPVLSVRGREGDKPVKTYQVKAAGQLPEDFEFVSKREEMIFAQAIAAQELQAQRLKAEFDQSQQREQFDKFNTQENEDIRSDMGQLQREGLLPKFTKTPNDPKFEDDPGVKMAQEIMDYMNERNQKYAEAKKAYRISFRDAFDQLRSQGKIGDQQESEEQRQEDQERKRVTRQTAGVRTTSGRSAGARPAPSMQALIDRIDNLDWQ